MNARLNEKARQHSFLEYPHKTCEVHRLPIPEAVSAETHKIHHSVDTLTYTVDREVELENVLPLHDALQMTGAVEPTKWRSYNRVMHLENATVAYHTDRPDMKTCVHFTGTNLYHLYRAGLTAEQLLTHAVKHGANIPRLDYAVDFFGPSSPQELFEEAEAGRVWSYAHTYNR